MACKIFITIDTEMSLALYQQGWSAKDNMASSIFGVCASGSYGISYQMDQLEKYGLTGVFFVDPLSSLLFGQELLNDIVEPILTRGHEVQLHIHTEWLEFLPDNPAGNLLGHNIGDFPLDIQIMLLGLAEEKLQAAGAPPSIAFRAGNYGANDDTLRALHRLGIAYDSSFNASYLGEECRITLPANTTILTEKLGMKVLPVGAIMDTPTTQRHAQVCALSSWEMRDALDHCGTSEQPHFVTVTHSFELLSRDRMRLNAAVQSRFESMCSHIAKHPELESGSFNQLATTAEEAPTTNAELLPPFLIRRLTRIGKQALYRLVIER